MKIFVSVLLFLHFIGLGVSQAQGLKMLSDIEREYSKIPDTLSVELYQERLERLEKEYQQLVDTVTDPYRKKIASLMRYSGLLWGPCYHMLTRDLVSMKDVISEKVRGCDLDSPDLNLLSDIEIINLITGYLNFYYPEMLELDRATYVLYNVKSEKVRNAYVSPILVSYLKQCGYTDEVKALLEDIDICSKSEKLRELSSELKNRYYPLRKGQVAPEIVGVDENGRTVKLSDYRGKIVFIDVWATWCSGCIEGLPYFMKLQEKYKGRHDLVFLTVTEDDMGMEGNWKKFLRDNKYSGKVPHLWLKDLKKFDEDYCITGIPRYILIDKAGKIVDAWHVSVKHELFSFIFEAELEQLSME